MLQVLYLRTQYGKTTTKYARNLKIYFARGQINNSTASIVRL